MFGKQSKITLMILSLCLLSILILGIGIFLWQQQAVKTNELRNETAQLMAKKAEIEEKLGPNDKNISIEAKKLDTKRQSLKILNKNLMDFQYIPKFLKYVQNAAQETGNELVSIAPGEAKPIDFNNPIFKPAPTPASDDTPAPPPPPPSPVAKDPKKQYKSLPITIIMRGTYVSNVKFIDALRKFPQIIYIKNLTLSPNEINGKIVVNSIVTANALIVPEQYINSTKARSDKDKNVDNPDTTGDTVDKTKSPVVKLGVKKEQGNVTDKVKTNQRKLPPTAKDIKSVPAAKTDNAMPVKVVPPVGKTGVVVKPRPAKTPVKAEPKKPVTAPLGGTIQ